MADTGIECALVLVIVDALVLSTALLVACAAVDVQDDGVTDIIDGQEHGHEGQLKKTLLSAGRDAFDNKS